MTQVQGHKVKGQIHSRWSRDACEAGERLRTAKPLLQPGALALAAEGTRVLPPPGLPMGPIRESAAAAGGRTLGPCVGGTWKQEGHMVMEASGSRERKYCHCRAVASARGPSRRLMERSTGGSPPRAQARATLLQAGQGGEWGLAQPAGTRHRGAPEPSLPVRSLRRTQLAVSVTGSPPPSPGGPECAEEKVQGQALGRGPGVSAAHHSGCPAPQSSAWP